MVIRNGAAGWGGRLAWSGRQSLALALLLVLVLGTVPEFAPRSAAAVGKVTLDECADGDGLTAPDQLTASALAVQCGVPVEIEASADGSVQRVAEPDGTVTMHSYPAAAGNPGGASATTADEGADRIAWTMVADDAHADTTWWDDDAWPRSEGLLRMGRDRDDGSVWRSMARFDTGALQGATINSAQVGLRVRHFYACSTGASYPMRLQLWQVRAITAGSVPTSWSSTAGDWLRGGPLDTGQFGLVHGQGCVGTLTGGSPRDMTFDGAEIARWVQHHADTPYASISFGLRSDDEPGVLYAKADLDSFVLTVNYSPVLAVPGELSTDQVGCLAPAGSRVTGSGPVLAGVPQHSGGTVRAGIEIRAADGDEPLRTWTSQDVPSGQAVSWQVAQPLPDGRYRWRMRSEGGGDVGQWSGWCEFTADAARDAEPDPAAAEAVECPTGLQEPLTAGSESTALLLAQACDAEVEVLPEREYGARVVARPEGTLVAEQYTMPQWTSGDDGEWVDVDPAFALDAEGRPTTVAAVSQIVASPGGEGPLLTATDPDGGAVSLHWPDPLPVPVLDGATVTYPEVHDDVDLRVHAGVDGFSYVLGVKSPAAPPSPELARVSVGITAEDLTLGQDDDGAVVLRDPTGEPVFTAPAAYMWDSSTPDEPVAPLADDGEEGSGEPGDAVPGRFLDMSLELADGMLTVEPDQELLGDPEVEFPVLIDPPFSGKRMHWASVHREQAGRGWADDSSWPRAGGMRIGNLQYWPGHPCGDACGLWRSAIRFDIRGLAGRQVVSAAVKAVQTHTSGCGSYGLELYYVTAFSSGTSWNGLQDNWRDRLQTRTLASSNRTGGCSGSTPSRGVTFDNAAVRNRVQTHADAGHHSLSFGFRSANESSKHAYRRLAVGSVKLEVEYNRPAQLPTGLNTDGRGCATSAPGPWVTTQRPTLSGTPRDPDGRVGAHLQIRRIGSSSTHYSWQSAANRTHNTVVNHRISATKRLASGQYRWRMRSLDSHPRGSHSGWRQWCYFRVDVTAPTTPLVELVGDPPQAGEPVTLRFTSSDAHSGLDGFHFGVDEEVKRTFRASSGTTEITVTTPAAGGRNWIYVWARDKAGNYSNRAVFDFFAARYVEATPVAAWRLDGDGLDDSGHGHELTLGGGVSWAADAAAPADTSLDFDGTGCVATGEAVVRTDAEYTVAAWVRLDSDAVSRAVLAPGGRLRSAFTLRYNAEDNRWIFVLGDRDARTGVNWATLRSAQPPTLGEWTHLAVRVDPAARHMQMYVNGELSTEGEIPWITWHADGPMYVGCSGPAAGSTWGHFTGAIHHVGVWQGLLTPAQIHTTYRGELPAGGTGDWRLRGDGGDASPYARELTAPPFAGWVEDQYGRPRSAIRLTGDQWVDRPEAVVTTRQSYSVAAWAKLDDKLGFRTAVSQTGTHLASFNLNYHPHHDRWQFSMPSADAASGVTWHRAQSATAPVAGQWYHLVGVYDRDAGQIRLYVDGELAGTAAGPTQPWHAAGGEFVIGATGFIGERSNPMVGSVSDVRTWRGALTDEQVSAAFGNPAVKSLARWNLDASGADQVGSHPLTVVGTEGVDYDWVEDMSCRPWRALGLRVTAGAYAHSSGPVLVTDESFTVATWVRLDSLTGGNQTVLSQGGGALPAMALRATPDGRWQFSMPHEDSSDSDWVTAQSAAGTAEAGRWSHLAAVFDLASGELRLYVNGELVDRTDRAESPWQGEGPWFIGAAGTTAGAATDHLHGAVDTVAAWSSTLDPDRIHDLAAPLPGVGGPCL